MSFEKRCWAEIDLTILRENFESLQKMANGTPMFAVVKGNAYGHGDVVVSQKLEEWGAKQFAVACLEEGLRLRQNGIMAPILILGYTSPEAATVLAVNNLTAVVHNLKDAETLSDIAVQNKVTVRAHLKADTGMGRIGFEAVDNLQKAAEEMAKASTLPNLKITGMFTHFSVADSLDESDIEYTEKQFNLFKNVIAEYEKLAPKLPMYHCTNSGALLQHKYTFLDAVRPGTLLFGCSPVDGLPCPEVKTAMVLKATIAQVKEIKTGTFVGYGRTFEAEKPIKLATVTVGYADGYPRALSNKGTMSVNGKPAPIVGRVCMDQTMIDVSDCGDVKSGDVVVVFGADAADSIPQAANKAGTVEQDIQCAPSIRVARIYK